MLELLPEQKKKGGMSGGSVCLLQKADFQAEEPELETYLAELLEASAPAKGGKRMTEIRIGTRGSRLALVQTGMVADALRACLPDARIETVIIKTKGDRILDKPLGEIGDKRAVCFRTGGGTSGKKKVDIAVHSAKDLPMCLAEGLEILAVPPKSGCQGCSGTGEKKRLGRDRA